jgi:hypothetical protein
MEIVSRSRRIMTHPPRADSFRMTPLVTVDGEPGSRGRGDRFLAQDAAEFRQAEEGAQEPVKG